MDLNVRWRIMRKISCDDENAIKFFNINEKKMKNKCATQIEPNQCQPKSCRKKWIEDFLNYAFFLLFLTERQKVIIISSRTFDGFKLCRFPLKFEIGMENQTKTIPSDAFHSYNSFIHSFISFHFISSMHIFQ